MSFGAADGVTSRPLRSCPVGSSRLGTVRASAGTFHFAGPGRSDVPDAAAEPYPYPRTLPTNSSSPGFAVAP